MNKKRVLFLLNLLLFFVLTCNISIAQADKTAKSGLQKPDSLGKKSISKTSSLFLKRWNLIEINKLKVKNTSAFIEFNSTEKRFAGSAGCNQMFGKFEANNSKIKLSAIGTTRMLCTTEGVMKIEGDFIKALGQVTRFEQKGDTLNLFAENNLILRFSGAAKNASGKDAKR